MIELDYPWNNGAGWQIANNIKDIRQGVTWCSLVGQYGVVVIDTVCQCRQRVDLNQIPETY